METTIGGSSGGGGSIGAVIDDRGDDDVFFQHVDPFLVEALQNPRHRLTVLRMEFDVHKFLQNPDLHQFEFQHFPTSYLRCAAHRVAQYYGLQTLSLDNTIDGSGSRILVSKTPDSGFRTPFLSDLPMKKTESEITGLVKIAIRPRPNGASLGKATELERKLSPPRTVEERKEDYVKARARIFSCFETPEVECELSVGDEKNMCLLIDESEFPKGLMEENEKIALKDGAPRVAIFRDREKDRYDPDYDRSYDRYSRGLALGPNFGLGACSAPPSPFIPYEGHFPQAGHVPRMQSSLAYSLPLQTPPSTSGAFGAFSSSHSAAPEAVYVQWPTTASIYNQSFEHFRRGVFQVPFYQQPLSFEHLPNH